MIYQSPLLSGLTARRTSSKNISMTSFKSLKGAFDSNDGAFFKAKQGANRVRIVSEPIEVYSIYSKGSNSFRKFLTEKAALEAKTHLSPDERFSKKYAMYIINRDTSQVQIAEFGPSIMKELVTLASSDDYGFEDVPPYDVTITKTGEQMETEYAVLPARANTELTKEELLMIGEKPDLMDELLKSAEDAIAVPPAGLR